MDYTTGDTIRAQVNFRNFAVPPAVGSLVDPDTVTVTIYDDCDSALSTHNVDLTNNTEHPSTGIFNYDWILPLTEGRFFIEFKGQLGTEPTIIRKAVRTKFAPN